jgi:predicted alpha/beta superfamily hydrolase
MKRFSFVLILCVLATVANANHFITIRLQVDSDKNNTSYFFASNLNGWNPASKDYQFQQTTAGFCELKIELPNVDLISFKITKGSWDLVECDESGKDVSNRVIEVSKIIKDTIINIKIKRWKDDFVGVLKKSTASKNVKIISEQFNLTRLGKTRRIWVYTPSDYSTSTKKYAVMYMHDGQNLFDELTGPFGEWGVDECMDSMSKKLALDLIIVGIDNGMSDRLSEYSPYDFKVKADEVNTWDVKGTGTNYLESIVYDLKPHIDSVYRTKKDAKNTVICGSSMGGLISLYGIMRYPSVFGKAGVFSPAFWTNMDSLKMEISQRRTDWQGNVYMMAGGLEGKRYSDNLNEIHALLISQSKQNIPAKIIENGVHNEAFWRSDLPFFLQWIASKP